MYIIRVRTYIRVWYSKERHTFCRSFCLCENERKIRDEGCDWRSEEVAKRGCGSEQGGRGKIHFPRIFTAISMSFGKISIVNRWMEKLKFYVDFRCKLCKTLWTKARIKMNNHCWWRRGLPESEKKVREGRWRILRNFLTSSSSTSGGNLPARLRCLSLIHIWRCRRSTLCRSRWSPYH